MRVLLVHPSALMYSEIFLRLEPLGLERVASALLAEGHDVRLVDLQVYRQAELQREVAEFRPEAIGFSLNYLANVPEVVNLAKWVKTVLPGCTVFVGGHSVSFVADQVLQHADGAIDAVLKGEGEVGAPALLAALPDGGLGQVPGIVTLDGPGRPPAMMHSLDDQLPARQLGRRRRKYFIGVMDPAASIEFTRGCPWDCSFCSAWTFYGRSYRRLSPEAAAEDMSRIAEPGVFIVDDVAFIKAEEGDEIARQLERRGIHKQYYLETRCDVLLRNEEVFRRWRRLGLNYMFLGPGGAGRGRAEGVPQADHAEDQQQGAGSGPVHGAERGHQHHRRPGLGRGAVRVRPGLGDERAGDRQPHRADALPGDRDLVHRSPPADHARLPPVRRAARGAADPAAAAPVL